MCLTVDNHYHPKGVSLKAEADISVIKVLTYLGNDEFCTPYLCMGIKFTDGVYCYKAKRLIKSKMTKYNLFPMYDKTLLIRNGIHSFTTDSAAQLCIASRLSSNRMMFCAIIPKGSRFFIGEDDDIVSTNLIVFKTKEDYIKYKQKSGASYTLDAYLKDFWHRYCNRVL